VLFTIKLFDEDLKQQIPSLLFESKQLLSILLLHEKTKVMPQRVLEIILLVTVESLTKAKWIPAPPSILLFSIIMLVPEATVK
jgi:hypothetical protein